VGQNGLGSANYGIKLAHRGSSKRTYTPVARKGKETRKQKKEKRSSRAGGQIR